MVQKKEKYHPQSHLFISGNTSLGIITKPFSLAPPSLAKKTAILKKILLTHSQNQSTEILRIFKTVAGEVLLPGLLELKEPWKAYLL